jgi:hypothetical protein
MIRRNTQGDNAAGTGPGGGSSSGAGTGPGSGGQGAGTGPGGGTSGGKPKRARRFWLAFDVLRAAALIATGVLLIAAGARRMTARAIPVRRRLVAALILFALADMAWGPAGCDACASRRDRAAVTR